HSLTLFSLLFFFLCYVPHLHLHSFPTRRSSDLTTILDSRVFKSCRLVARHRIAIISDATVILKPSSRGTPRFGPPKPTTISLNEDRKSTRLNSSHVSISYAVFCLKKKNKQNILN